MEVSTVANAKIPVLFVHTATLPPLGADTWIHGQIIRDLDRGTYELHVACTIGDRENLTPTYRCFRRIANIDLHPVDFGTELNGRTLGGKVRALVGSTRAVFSIVGLAILVRRKKVPLIHTSDRPRDAAACIILARVTGAKCIIHNHVGYGEWMSPLLKWSLRRADALIAISEFVGQTLVASGHQATKVHVVRNAIDPTDWNPGEGRDDVRREFDIPEHAPVVVTICRLFPSKGPEDLIRAIAGLHQQFPAIRLIVVGDEMVTGFRAHLEELAASLDAAGSVIFTGRRTDVGRLLAAADIFAMPSREEPFGLVFLEAMAMKLPVVALDSGGTPEVVQDGVTGLLSQLGDVDRLADHVRDLIGDPVRREMMGARGRQEVEANFTTARMAADTARVYRRLTSPEPARIELEG